MQCAHDYDIYIYVCARDSTDVVLIADGRRGRNIIPRIKAAAAAREKNAVEFNVLYIIIIIKMLLSRRRRRRR